MVTQLKSALFAALFVLAVACLGGCKDESGSSDVKPNPSQANRYKQGRGHGAPPGVSGAQTGVANNAPQ